MITRASWAGDAWIARYPNPTKGIKPILTNALKISCLAIISATCGEY
jgi:hypothetical protein